MNARYLPKRDEDISIADSTIVFPVTLDSGLGHLESLLIH
jgi:hypothetical protein